MTLDEILKNVPSEARNKLRYAFENGTSYYFEYEFDRYVGVNCERIKKLVPDQTIGAWSIGVIHD